MWAWPEQVADPFGLFYAPRYGGFLSSLPGTSNGHREADGYSGLFVVLRIGTSPRGVGSRLF